MDIEYVVFGLLVTIPKEPIEQKVKEMDTEQFEQFARRFSRGCIAFSDRSWFKSEEDWRKCEEEHEEHRLIRREGRISLHWDNNQLVCFIQPEHCVRL